MAKYKVTATSQGKVRTETIDASKNVLFKRAKNEGDVANAYESFWNINKYEPIVKVIKVRKLKSKPLFSGKKLGIMSMIKNKRRR